MPGLIVFLIQDKCQKSKELRGEDFGFRSRWWLLNKDDDGRFPAHEHISGASKIPTIIYYDLNGKVRAVGAEAMREGIYEIAEDENWVKAEW